MRIIHWFLRVLFSEKSSHAVGWAILPGYVIGVFPLSLQWFLAIASVLIMRLNVAAVLASGLIFGFLTIWFDSLSHNIGESILLIPLLEPLWSRLYHAPIVPFTLFNHSTVMGYLMLSFAIIPLCMSTQGFFESYHQKFIHWIYSTQFWQSFISSRFYRRFSQYLRYETK